MGHGSVGGAEEKAPERVVSRPCKAEVTEDHTEAGAHLLRCVAGVFITMGSAGTWGVGVTMCCVCGV